MDPEAIGPRWARFGLRGDPYWSNPLDPDDVSNHPITLFRGRKQELKSILSSVTNGEHSAIVIHAAGGYGKSTLASAATYHLGKRGYLTPPHEVQLDVQSGLGDLFHQIVRGLLAAAVDADVPLPAGPDDPAFPGLAEARYRVQHVVATASQATGATIAGFGGSFSRASQVVTPRFAPVMDRQLLTRIRDDIAAHGIDFPGIVVRINNLDVAWHQDREGCQRFLHDFRDLFQLDGFHWLLMGDTDLAHFIESEPRIRGVFESPVALEAFSQEDLHAILDGRYRFMAIQDPIPPASKQLVEVLHETHYGDLRNILRDLRRTVELVDPERPHPIEAEDGLPLLAKHHAIQLGRRLSDHDWAMLEAFGSDEARRTDIAERLDTTLPNISRRFKAIDEAGLIELTRTHGRSEYYRLAGHARLALQGRAQS